MTSGTETSATVGRPEADYRRILAGACAAVGIKPAELRPIRLGENGIFRLPGGVVARIARPGQVAAAAKEVAVSHWLAAQGVPAVRVFDVSAEQPVVVDDRAVTFWVELPEHRHGEPRDVAVALRQLHGLYPPEHLGLPEFAPFVRLAERTTEASTIPDHDRRWLLRRLDELRARFAHLPTGLPHRVIHGDAWAGNVAVTTEGYAVLLDLERCSIGPPEWDLVSTAIRLTTFGTITADQYEEFAAAYGHDVITWEGFELFRDMRELRVTCYAAQRATEDPRAQSEVTKRIACLRGERGPRPWTDWRALT